MSMPWGRPSNAAAGVAEFRICKVRSAILRGSRVIASISNGTNYLLLFEPAIDSMPAAAWVNTVATTTDRSCDKLPGSQRAA